MEKDLKKIRINKAIALSGLYSRRKAEELITAGRIKVNEKIVKDLNIKISPEVDLIKVDEKPLELKEYKYLILNKPRGYISTTNDESGRKHILDLLPSNFKNLKFAGRLDRDSEGLMILSNDGLFLNHILHPKNKIEKSYVVYLKEYLKEQEILVLKRKLENGLKISGELYKVDNVEINAITVKNASDKKQTNLKIVLHEGKNRQIRKMIQYLGYSVANLKRVQVAGFSLNGIKKGSFLELSKKEAYAKLFLAQKIRNL